MTTLGWLESHLPSPCLLRPRSVSPVVHLVLLPKSALRTGHLKIQGRLHGPVCSSVVSFFLWRNRCGQDAKKLWGGAISSSLTAGWRLPNGQGGGHADLCLCLPKDDLGWPTGSGDIVPSLGQRWDEELPYSAGSINPPSDQNFCSSHLFASSLRQSTPRRSPGSQIHLTPMAQFVRCASNWSNRYGHICRLQSVSW